ncbi:hypothetical protein [Pseudaminobacter soli (ex Li et al. 2025)]|uniref:Uncharacterized protein n=1 Tax=Pseudaminobacter soli (ex Li et al. 2025) TaxID=1295366 RepID=A0A2P7RZY2_9HYPH|nr:hypothetical protein C7I85_26230 [Mesorhizobium soli]
METLLKLTTPLDCTMAYLTGQSDQPDGGPTFDWEYMPKYAKLSDYLEAGVYRKALWATKDDPRRTTEGDLIYNDLRLIGWEYSLFKLKDRSMDLLNLVEGDLITAAHGEMHKKDIRLVPGRLVVVRFGIDEIRAAETSLRLVEVEGDEVRLVTKSSVANEDPIVLGKKLDRDDGLNMYRAKPMGVAWVMALAVRATRNLPLLDAEEISPE